jgi:hypothetical protein
MLIFKVRTQNSPCLKYTIILEKNAVDGQNIRRSIILGRVFERTPITVAAQSKARNVFARWNTGIMGLNPTQDMDICFYSVFVLSCVGSGLATG